MKKVITVILLSIISISVFCQDAIQESEGDAPGQEFYKRYVYSDLSLTLGFTASIVPLPDLHIGYKYQKPGKHLIFKSGVGFPKGIDVGVGYAF